MAANQSIQVAAEVPILLQIADGATDQYPQAEVRDNEANLLATYNLTHQASGVYIPSLPYSMPDESFIKVTYIVFEDIGHLIESTVYERDLDVFYRVVPGDYKATGFAVPDEYDAALLAIQNEVAGLDGEAMRGTDSVPLNPLLTNDARLNSLDATISSRSPAGEYQAALIVIQNEVDGLDGAAMRGTDGAYTGTPPTPTEIDTELTGTHGVGSWQKGGGATPAEVDAELTANHGAGSWQKGSGMSESEHHTSLDNYANKDGYKANVTNLDVAVSSRAVSNEYDLVLADIMTEVAGLDGDSIPSTVDVAAAIFGKIVEGTLTFNDFQRIMLAMLSGTSSGHETVSAPKVYKSEDGLIDRVAFTCDADGNRLTVVKDLS